MNINSYIFLGIGLLFATLYAVVIITGWAKTRTNRRALQRLYGISIVPTLVFDTSIINPPSVIKTISLKNNYFIDQEGSPIDVNSYSPYIAIGESIDNPGIRNGNLILKDKEGNIKYVFVVPDLDNYR